MTYDLKTFVLERAEDATGVSGTGVVAEGVMFTNGRCVMRWIVPNAPNSTAIYDSLEDLIAIHGHNGMTRVTFVGSVTG